MRQIKTILSALLTLGLLVGFDAYAGNFRVSVRSVSEPPKPASHTQKARHRSRPAPRVIILHPHGFTHHRFHYGPHYGLGHGAFDQRLHPFFCSYHGTVFTSQAGFLDHVSGTHKVPLQQAVSLCADDGSSCFLGY